jgi:hypothetical protein
VIIASTIAKKAIVSNDARMVTRQRSGFGLN